MEYTGYTGWDKKGQCWVPKHSNADSRPYPFRDRWGRPMRAKLGVRDVMFHSWSEPLDALPQFYFYVSSPGVAYALITFDIDGNDYEKAVAIREWLYAELLKDVPVFREPSRNRKGCYLRMIVCRDSCPAEFNALCNRLTVLLRRRFHDLGEVTKEEFHRRKKERVNFFDGIKGTLHYDDRDDTARLYAHADGNPNDNHRGLLATIPCSGWEADGVEGGNRMRSFLRFCKKRVSTAGGVRTTTYVNAVPQSRLRELLALLRPQRPILHVPSAVPTSRPSSTAVPPLHQSSPSESSDGGERSRSAARVKKPKRQREEARKQVLEKAKDGSNPMLRMRLASCLYFYEYGGYADTPDELVTYYERLGLHTGLDEHGRRRTRAEEAVAKHKADPAKPVSEQAHFDADLWVPLVQKYVTDEVRRHPSIKYRYPIHEVMLAAGAFLFTLNSMQVKRSDWMHTCGQKAQKTLV